MAGFGLGQAIRFGSNLVMTRFLIAEMFGAIATMVMYGLLQAGYQSVVGIC